MVGVILCSRQESLNTLIYNSKEMTLQLTCDKNSEFKIKIHLETLGFKNLFKKEYEQNILRTNGLYQNDW